MLENSDSIGHRFYNCLLESSDEGPMPLLDGCSFLEELLGVEGCLQRIKEGSSLSREIKKELIDGFCEDSVTATYLFQKKVILANCLLKTVLLAD